MHNLSLMPKQLDKTTQEPVFMEIVQRSEEILGQYRPHAAEKCLLRAIKLHTVHLDEKIKI